MEYNKVTHPSNELLAAFGSRRFGSVESARIQARPRACERCRAALKNHEDSHPATPPDVHEETTCPPNGLAALTLKLVVISGKDEGRTFPLVPGKPLQVGRSKTTQTGLTDPHVSRVHCEVHVGGDRAQVIDSGSVGGTFINGNRITQEDLKPGDVIRVGETELRLEQVGRAKLIASSPAAAPRAASTPVKPGVATKAAVPALADLVGKTVAHYEVRHAIATGQTGMVFHARDTRHNCMVALKVLKEEFARNDELMRRFFRAMKTMFHLQHPNLVTIYNAGKSGPFCWVSMEHVEGESLEQVMRQAGIVGRLDWRRVFRITRDIARALEFAHQRDIVHRNLTPRNVLLQSSDKSAKLGDLMLAKAMAGSDHEITAAGQLLGNVQYMSPEHTYGSATVDCRSDLYSLGALTYALLAGRPPFQERTLPETILKIREAEPEKLKKYQLAIPDMFEGTVLRLLAKSPDERHQSASLLLADLTKLEKSGRLGSSGYEPTQVE